jgi:hypothetical protein
MVEQNPQKVIFKGATSTNEVVEGYLQNYRTLSSTGNNYKWLDKYMIGVITRDCLHPIKWVYVLPESIELIKCEFPISLEGE